MKSDTIMIGTENELSDYFCSIMLPPIQIPTDINSKEGIQKQLQEIQIKTKGIGMVFYLEPIRTSTNEEVNLVLQGCYVHIRPPIPNPQL